MKINFQWNKPIQQIVKVKSGDDKGRLFLANEAKRLMDPYVPARNLVLAQNVRVYVEGDNGVVEYLSPYAHYQFIGELYVDPETGKGAFTDGEGNFWSRPGVAKVPSGRKLDYDTFRHPLATSHWDQAMKTARIDDLMQEYQEFINGGKK